MSNHPFNQLSDAEAERLAILAEECAEVIQAVGKIKRYGYQNWWPKDTGFTNRQRLEYELGHVDAAVSRLVYAAQISRDEIDRHRSAKLESIKPFLHHSDE